MLRMIVAATSREGKAPARLTASVDPGCKSPGFGRADGVAGDRWAFRGLERAFRLRPEFPHAVVPKREPGRGGSERNRRQRRHSR